MGGKCKSCIEGRLTVGALSTAPPPARSSPTTCDFSWYETEHSSPKKTQECCSVAQVWHLRSHPRSSRRAGGPRFCRRVSIRPRPGAVRCRNRCLGGLECYPRPGGATG